MDKYTVPAAVLLLCWPPIVMAGDTPPERVERVNSPAAERPNVHYVSNRDPLHVSPLIKLPIGSVQPRGWLRHAGASVIAGSTSCFIVKVCT